MKILTEGHKYELSNFENTETAGQVIQFIHKESIPDEQIKVIGTNKLIELTGRLKTISDGTTNEEVLEVMINRMNYLQSKFPCRENAIVITKLEESLMWLNKRTQDRLKRNVEGKHLT